MKNLTFLIASFILFFINEASSESLGTKQVRIRIISENIKIEAVLNDSVPAQDLLKKLPITLNLYKHQDREYYSYIKLDKSNQTQNKYQVGDIAYWAPGNSLVLFYNKGYTDNLIIMGKMTVGLNELTKMENSFQARIEKIED